MDERKRLLDEIEALAAAVRKASDAGIDAHGADLWWEIHSLGANFVIDVRKVDEELDEREELEREAAASYRGPSQWHYEVERKSR